VEDTCGRDYLYDWSGWIIWESWLAFARKSTWQNRLTPSSDPTDRQVSVGEAVQAMVLNALGFVGSPPAP
jgi:hypothetical protein